MSDPYSPCSLVSDSAGSSRSGHSSPDNYSHAHSSSLSPTNLNGYGTLSETLSDDEILQIESFYKGLHSRVYVSPTVAALYLFVDGPSNKEMRSNHKGRNPPRTPSREDSLLTREHHQSSGSQMRSPQKAKTGWSLEFAEGVPCIVHVTRAEKRGVHFVYAERATGFPLWTDLNLSPASKYTCVDSDYHEFCTSSLRVGLRFGMSSGASRFLQEVITLVANPGTFVETANRKNQTPKKAKYVRPKKTSISPPCCFQHKTSVNKDDELISLSEFVSPGRKNGILPVQNTRASMLTPSSSMIYSVYRS